jgi:hypothetical protein
MLVRPSAEQPPGGQPLETLSSRSVDAAAVPQAGGSPLSPALRTQFEPRLGYGLHNVRVHTGHDAARLAGLAGARAYTTGPHVVFAPGEYRPSTTDGLRLLAHELAHVVQQGAGGSSRPPGGDPAVQLTPVPDGSSAQLQRCLPTICPPVTLPLDGSGFNWEAAEICLQNQYPYGGVVGSNKSWTTLQAIPGTPEGRDLQCFKQHLAAKSGMFLAQPDIIDFTRAEIYDVTTPKQAGKHWVRLWADTGEATALSAIPDCSGASRLWTPGKWQPAPCYALGGDLYMRAWNQGGLLLYQILRDLTKEALTAMALAAIYAAAKKQGGGKLGTAIATRNPYVGTALAACAVAIVLTTDAEVAFAADGDPVTSMLNALKANGLEVPPEIRNAIMSDPQLRAQIEAAFDKSGKPSDRAKRASNELMKLIAANKDKFSREDLEALASAMQTVAGDVPGSPATVESLRKQIDAIRSGRGRDPGATQDGGHGEASGSRGRGTAGRDAPSELDQDTARESASDRPAPLRQDTLERLAAAPERVRRLFEELTVKDPNGTGLPTRDEDVDRFLAMVPPTLDQETLDALLTRERDAKATTTKEALDRLEQALADRRQDARYPGLKPETDKKMLAAPELVQRIFEEFTKPGDGQGPRLTDAAVERFLKIMSAGLTPARYEAIAKSLQPIRPDESVETWLRDLEKRVAAADRASKQGGGGSKRTNKKDKDKRRETGTSEERAAKRDPKAGESAREILSTIAWRTDPKTIEPGKYRVRWTRAAEKATSDAVWFHRGSAELVCAAFLKVRIEQLTAERVFLTVLEATAAYDEFGDQIYTGAELVGMTLSVRPLSGLDQPAGKATP